MDSPQEQTIFSTRDLYLASTLVTLKFPVISIDIQYEGIKPKAIGYFNFANNDEISQAKSDYMQGLLKIEPRSFISNLQSLKAEVVNAQNNPNYGA